MKKESATKGGISIKAQASAELIIITAIFFLIFIAFIFVAYKNSDILDSVITEKYAKDKASRVAQEINAAYISGDGYFRTAQPIVSRTGQEYNIAINSTTKMVLVEWTFKDQNRVYGYPILTSNVTGNLLKADTSEMNFTNTKGQVVIG